MKRLHTSKNNFCWWIVTDIAEKLFDSEAIELYVLYDDDSESLIESKEELFEAINLDLPIAMELGYIKDEKPKLWTRCERYLRNGHWYIKLADLTKLL